MDVRLACAANRDPLAKVEAERFRETWAPGWMWFLPPLRARDGDPVLIAATSCRPMPRRSGRGSAPEAEAAIRAHPWLGNLRQVQDAVSNAVAMRDGERREAGVPEASAAAMPILVPPPARAEPVLARPVPHIMPWTPPLEPPPALPVTGQVRPRRQMGKRLIMAALAQTRQDVPRRRAARDRSLHYRSHAAGLAQRGAAGGLRLSRRAS